MSLIYKTIAAMNAINRDDLEDKDAQIAALRAEVVRLTAALEQLLTAMDRKEHVVACKSSGTALSRTMAVNGVMFAKRQARAALAGEGKK